LLSTEALERMERNRQAALQRRRQEMEGGGEGADERADGDVGVGVAVEEYYEDAVEGKGGGGSFSPPPEDMDALRMLED
jgi:hypothetical protein